MNGIAYRHYKTGNVYEVLAHVTNATNDRDGQGMVLYRDGEGRLFVREAMEFHMPVQTPTGMVRRFTPVEDGEVA